MTPIQATARSARLLTEPHGYPIVTFSDVDRLIREVIERKGRRLRLGVIAAELHFRFHVELLTTVTTVLQERGDLILY